MLNLLSEEARKGFYPTPPDVAKRMLAKVKWNNVQYVLEPSAGKGDLVFALLEEMGEYFRYRKRPEIDCVEIDQVLRETLNENIYKRRLSIREEIKALEEKGYDGRTHDENKRLRSLESEWEFSAGFGVHIVHDDFLTYHTYTAYHLCIMNPPFSNGDIHLLHAIEIMGKHGGQIVCLLNAETIRNPYTHSRKALAKKLEEYDADIEFLDSAFVSAERRTDVDVAIVYISIPEPERRSEFYERMKEAADKKIENNPELKELVAGNYLEQAVQIYRVEVDATEKLIKEYIAMLPYIGSSLIDKKSGPMLTLAVQEYGNSYSGYNHNAYLGAVRLKYWGALLHNEKYVGKLTTKVREQYQAEIDRLKDYEFSMFNIQQVYIDMQKAMSKGIEESVLDLFDTMTVKYAHWTECKTTEWLYNGWKTNKAHKIGPKVILPENAYDFSYYSHNSSFSTSRAYAVLSDIEKVLDYLNAQPMSDGYDLMSRLSAAEQSGHFRNVELKYFNVDFFKKGTIHIKFLADAMPIVERLNILGSQNHGWLPPNYGKKAYSEMDAEEKAVVDSFHGDGAQGSGKEKYEKVMREASYYLAKPTEHLPLLGAAQ